MKFIDVVHGSDGADAISKMREALTSFEIEGVPTTIGLHRQIMENPDLLGA